MRDNQRYGVGDIVILDDGTLAIIKEVDLQQYGSDYEYWYEVETRGSDRTIRATFEVSQDEIQGMA